MINQYGENTWSPGIRQDTFIPDQLIAGNLNLVTDTVDIAEGNLYVRGTVLGLQTQKTATATATATNTGNGVVSGLVVGTSAEVGAYVLKATSATEFSLTNATGESVGTVTVGTAFNSPQLTLTITAGATGFAIGDTFTVLVAAASNTWVACERTATDGSQQPAAILVNGVDSTAGIARAGVYLMGQFNENRITFDDSWTLDDLKSACYARSIYLRPSLVGPGV